FKPQELAKTAWAFATLGTPAPRLFKAIARESEQRIGSFNPQDLVDTTLAFATLGVPAPQLFDAIACESEQRIGSFSEQELANTAFEPQELANTAWAFATLGTPAPQLFDAIARESEQRIGSFNSKDLTNTAWAFAIAGTVDRGALVEAVSARAAEMGLAAFGSKERRQLHQFFLGVELEACPPFELLAPIGLRDACRQAMADEKPAHSSKIYEDVSRELTRMGIVHANELCVPRLGYHVDIAISPIATVGMPGTEGGGGAADQPLDEVAARAREAVRAVTAEHAGIVIKVDSPTHYDDERRLCPASEMIRRHLALAGWAVLAVPYWEWRALKGQGRKEYLAELLARAAALDSLRQSEGAAVWARRPSGPGEAAGKQADVAAAAEAAAAAVAAAAAAAAAAMEAAKATATETESHFGADDDGIETWAEDAYH
ncbi:hypothetical protein T492DRAFT_895524, partial [Pavlovales sp. CCMP2436]